MNKILEDLNDLEDKYPVQDEDCGCDEANSAESCELHKLIMWRDRLRTIIWRMAELIFKQAEDSKNQEEER